MAAAPGPGEVRRIAAIRDPVLRNLEPELARPPFTASQLTSIHSGAIPGGDL